MRTVLGAMMIVSAYIPPGGRFPTEELRDTIRSHTNTVLMGDLNAKNREWFSNSENTYGRQLSSLANTEHWDVLGPPQPTIYQTDRRRMS